jgi:hypothetical protein
MNAREEYGVQYHIRKRWVMLVSMGFPVATAQVDFDITASPFMINQNFGS